MSASLTSLLDLPAAELRALAASLHEERSAVRADGRVVAVLPFAPAPLPPAAWIAAAARLGAGVVRVDDLGVVPGTSPLDACLEAARWADVLVTTHARAGFARAVADRTGRAVVNAGEAGGEDPAAGLSLLHAVLEVHARDAVAAAREPHVAVCGDLRASAPARSLLAALAAVEATVLLVPAKGRELPDDALLRLARRTRRRPLRFEARTMRSLLDMVDTVLLAPEEAPQLPLFREVGVPPGDAERRARREVEDTDALFVAGGVGAQDRLVATPFRGRAVPEGRVHRTDPRAPGALLAFAVGPGAQRDASGLVGRYRSPLGLRCRSEDCYAASEPERVTPDFGVLEPDGSLLECLHCGTRVEPRWAGSREAGRHHPIGSADARKVLDQNLVLFRSRAEASALGFEPSRRAGSPPGA